MKRGEGTRSDRPARKLISVPTRKKMMSAVMPSGRACNALIIELQKNALLLPTAEHIEVLDKSVVG